MTDGVVKRAVYGRVSTSRRALLRLAVGTAGAFGLVGGVGAEKADAEATFADLAVDGRAKGLADRSALQTYRPEPKQPPVTGGTVRVDGSTLAYVDSGSGNGHAKRETVILAHAFTGSVASWGYQLPALVDAGYRVIAYSRRGHRGSGPDSGDRPGRTVDDLAALADALDVASFHLVGTAAGGATALDFTIALPQRVRTLTIASSLGGIDDRDYVARSGALTPKSFFQLPASLRELGPSYRASAAEGVARWVALEESARAPGTTLPLKRNSIGFADIARLDVPCLLLTGSADLYVPPSLMTQVASRFRRARFVVVPEAGHAAYWEQPDLFNAALLHFLRLDRKRTVRR